MHSRSIIYEEELDSINEIDRKSQSDSKDIFFAHALENSKKSQVDLFKVRNAI